MKKQYEKRKTVICSKCGKDRLNFGHGMCSACLRNWKRKTKPSFYLGTCFSEIVRRVKTFDPKRPVYFGLEICERQDFINKFKKDKQFLKQYKIWQDSNYQRGSAPSIDRIDNTKGYTLDNLQFLSNIENAIKESKISIVLTKNNEKHIFNTCKLAASFLKLDSTTFCVLRKKKGFYKGYKIEEL